MYIIKKHYVATENNIIFNGVVMDYYEGKGMTILSENQLPSDWTAQTYGYKTLAGAKRGLNAVNALCESETKDGAWVVTAEIISV